MLVLVDIAFIEALLVALREGYWLLEFLPDQGSLLELQRIADLCRIIHTFFNLFGLNKNIYNYEFESKKHTINLFLYISLVGNDGTHDNILLFIA